MAASNPIISFVGCGYMGGAVLHGLLDATSDSTDDGKFFVTSATKFIACTKSEGSATKLKATLKAAGNEGRVEVYHDQVIKAMQDSDIVMLGFKPYMAKDVLSLPGVREALEGKLVISLLAALSAEDIQSLIGAETAYVSKVVPNVAALYRQSTTLLEESPVPGILPPAQAKIVESIFSQVGFAKWVPVATLNAASMVMTASTVVMTIPYEGLLDGAVADGVRRPDAKEIALNGLKSMIALIENGYHPADIRESSSSPRGCTIQALLTVENAGGRGIFSRSLMSGVAQLKKMNSE